MPLLVIAAPNDSEIIQKLWNAVIRFLPARERKAATRSMNSDLRSLWSSIVPCSGNSLGTLARRTDQNAYVLVPIVPNHLRCFCDEEPLSVHQRCLAIRVDGILIGKRAQQKANLPCSSLASSRYERRLTSARAMVHVGSGLDQLMPQCTMASLHRVSRLRQPIKSC
jgi:hypothetical protein